MGVCRTPPGGAIRLRAGGAGLRADADDADRSARRRDRAVVHGLPARRPIVRLDRPVELSRDVRRPGVLDFAEEHADLCRHCGAGRSGARARHSAPDPERRRPAELVPHHLFPSRDGNADRDGDRLGIHAAPAVRAGERTVARRRTAGPQLAAGPRHRALFAVRDRHMAGHRLQHGAVSRRPRLDPKTSLRRGRDRRRRKRVVALPPGDMADARAGHPVRGDDLCDPLVSGVRHRAGADQGRALEIVRGADLHHVHRRISSSSAPAMARRSPSCSWACVLLVTLFKSALGNREVHYA